MLTEATLRCYFAITPKKNIENFSLRKNIVSQTGSNGLQCCSETGSVAKLLLPE